jgi:hypothetical protein
MTGCIMSWRGMGEPRVDSGFGWEDRREDGKLGRELAKGVRG